MIEDEYLLFNIRCKDNQNNLKLKELNLSSVLCSLEEKVEPGGNLFTKTGQNGRAHSKDGSGSPLVSWHFCYVRCNPGFRIFL